MSQRSIHRDHEIEVCKHGRCIKEAAVGILQLCPEVDHPDLLIEGLQLLAASAMLEAEKTNMGHARQHLEGLEWHRATPVPAVFRASLPDDAHAHVAFRANERPPMLHPSKVST